MYNLIIVEDEEISCNLIKKHIEETPDLNINVLNTFEDGLDAKNYLPQKLTQSTIAVCLAVMYSFFGLAAPCICTGIMLLSKKTVEISKSMMYNSGS